MQNFKENCKECANELTRELETFQALVTNAVKKRQLTASLPVEDQIAANKMTAYKMLLVRTADARIPLPSVPSLSVYIKMGRAFVKNTQGHCQGCPVASFQYHVEMCPSCSPQFHYCAAHGLIMRSDLHPTIMIKYCRFQCDNNEQEFVRLNKLLIV